VASGRASGQNCSCAPEKSSWLISGGSVQALEQGSARCKKPHYLLFEECFESSVKLQ